MMWCWYFINFRRGIWVFVTNVSYDIAVLDTHPNVPLFSLFSYCYDVKKLYNYIAEF